MDESPTPVLDVLLHPIRWRIVQRALGREVTTTDLKRDLPDIPTTTLYRHVAALIDAGYLTVVRERKIRGTTERTLSLDQTKVGRIDEREARAMTPEQHRQAFLMMLTRLAYRIIHMGSSIELPVDAGDFKLLSRAALNHLLALQESDPYLRGLVVWIGFQQAFVPYERDARHAGTTHFPFFSRNPWKTFAIGLTSFSFMPIFTVIGVAATAAIVTGVLVLVTLLLLVARGTVSTTLTLVTIGAVFWTTILAAIAAVGIYVIRIYKDIRNRPQYIVESTIGLSTSSEDAPAERAMR